MWKKSLFGNVTMLAVVCRENPIQELIGNELKFCKAGKEKLDLKRNGMAALPHNFIDS